MSNNNSRSLQDQIYDLVSSCHGMLEAGKLPEGDPSLPMVFGFAELLEIKLSELTNVETMAEREAREIRAMRRDTEGVQDAGVRRVVNKLADEMESDLDDDSLDTRPPHLGGDTDENTYDALGLCHERIETLAMAINDVHMSGEHRNVIGLAALIGEQVRIADRIMQANSKRWTP